MSPTSRARATVRWGYLFSPRGTGADVTETWQVRRILPGMGETDEQLATLRERTAQNVRASLDTLRRVLTDGPGVGPGS